MVIVHLELGCIPKYCWTPNYIPMMIMAIFVFFPTSMANGNPLVTSMKHPKLVPSRSVAELGAGFRPVEKVHSPFFCFCFRWSKPNALCLLVITITIVTS